jgi:hypothetical protein
VIVPLVAYNSCCEPSSPPPQTLTPTGPGRHHLLRRAGSAFDKFAKVLEKVAGDGDGLGTALGKDICHILLKVLLPVPAYCQRASVESFQGAGGGWAAGGRGSFGIRGLCWVIVRTGLCLTTGRSDMQDCSVCLPAMRAGVCWCMSNSIGESSTCLHMLLCCRPPRRGHAAL